MTRPIKHPPKFTQHHLYDLVTGRSPRKIYLPLALAPQINLLLKSYNVQYRIFKTEPKPIESTEESDKRLEVVGERSD